MTRIYESVTIRSTKPLRGRFRYKDIFQIIPSRRTALHPNHPIILQLALEKPEPYLRFSTDNSDILSREIVEKLHLLSLFSQFLFHGFTKRKKPIQSFSNANYPDVERQNIKWYQDKTLDDRNVDQIVFPKGIESWLDVCYSLDPEEKGFFRKAMYLFYAGVHLKPLYPSFSFLSLVSAIETLISSAKIGGTPCPKCGQPKYEVRRRFRDFVSYYGFNEVATGADTKFINGLYSKRSAIAHRGKILLADAFWDDAIGMVDWKESFLHRDLVLTTRACLVNWLVKEPDNRNRWYNSRA